MGRMSKRSVILAAIIVAVVYWSNYVKQKEEGSESPSLRVEKFGD
jgi:hypothetical protein